MRGFFAELPRDLEEAALGRRRFAARSFVASRVAVGRTRPSSHSRVLFDRFVERVSVCAGVNPDRCVR